jgi:hypothetical protein
MRSNASRSGENLGESAWFQGNQKHREAQGRLGRKEVQSVKERSLDGNAQPIQI